MPNYPSETNIQAIINGVFGVNQIIVTKNDLLQLGSPCTSRPDAPRLEAIPEEKKKSRRRTIKQHNEIVAYNDMINRIFSYSGFVGTLFEYEQFTIRVKDLFDPHWNNIYQGGYYDLSEEFKRLIVFNALNS